MFIGHAKDCSIRIVPKFGTPGVHSLTGQDLIIMPAEFSARTFLAVAFPVLIAQLYDQSWGPALTLQRLQSLLYQSAVVKLPSSGASMQ